MATEFYDNAEVTIRYKRGSIAPIKIKNVQKVNLAFDRIEVTWRLNETSLVTDVYCRPNEPYYLSIDH